MLYEIADPAQDSRNAQGNEPNTTPLHNSASVAAYTSLFLKSGRERRVVSYTVSDAQVQWFSNFWNPHFRMIIYQDPPDVMS